MTQKDELAEIRKKLGELETQVSEVRRFQSWVMGGLAVLGVVGVFLADKLKKLMGLA